MDIGCVLIIYLLGRGGKSIWVDGKCVLICSPNQNQKNIMAHSEGHSSTERTILWTILPATLVVSLYFTFQGDKVPARQHLGGDLGDLKKKEMPAPAKVLAKDTLHMDTNHVHVEAPATKQVETSSH
jgi:hypothetical protein